jgi:hypothetical protein
MTLKKFHCVLYLLHFRSEHFVQEADEETAKPVLVFVSPLARRLDLHGHGLPRSFGSLVCSGKVLSCQA